MPVSKHSHSGTMLLAYMWARNASILAIGLSKSMGGQAHFPSDFSFR